MSDLQQRVLTRIREDMLKHGASPALEDPDLFADVERLLRAAAERSDADALLLPELLGDPSRWRLQMAMPSQSHRSSRQAGAIVFIKRRILMPVFRWLFEYSRDNFERQRYVNHVLFACVQELAVETARLRRQLEASDAAGRTDDTPGRSTAPATRPAPDHAAR